MKLFLILLLILIVTQTQDYSCWYSGHACYNNVVSCKNEAKCVQVISFANKGFLWLPQ